MSVMALILTEKAEDEVGEDLAVLLAEAIVDKYPGFQLATR